MLDKYKIYKLFKREYKEQFGYSFADGVPFYDFSKIIDKRKYD